MLTLPKKAVTLSAIAALVLAGCSDQPTGATAGTEEDIAAIASVVWTVNEEGFPELVFEGPIDVSAPVGRVVADGDGDVVEPGHNITVDYSVVDGEDGEFIYSTYGTGDGETLTVNEDMLEPILIELLVGLRAGATIIYAAVDPSSGFNGAKPQTILMAITLRSTIAVLDRAEGMTVEPVEGLPTVTLADNGAPSLVAVDTDAPVELVVQLLIEGSGAPVAAGSTVTAHYTGWLWNGDEFESSWERGTPLSIPLSSVIDGWSIGLVDHPVGSQVLLIVPPEFGYGDMESATIPPGSTLVFVVDILAAG